MQQKSSDNKKALCSKEEACFWCLLILTAVISYGYTLSHPAVGIDDESLERFFGQNVLLTQNRYFYVLLRPLLNSYHYVPFWREAVGVVLLCFSLAILGNALKQYSGQRLQTRTEVIFVCIALSYPFVASAMVFHGMTLEVGLQSFFTSLSGWYFAQALLATKINYKAYVVSFIFCLLGTMTGQAGVINLFVCYAICVFVYVYFQPEHTKIRNLLRIYATIAGMLAISYIVSAVFCKIIQYFYNTTTSTYISSQYLKYDLSSLGNFCTSVLKFLKEMIPFFALRAKIEWGFGVFMIALILLPILVTIQSIRKRKICVFVSGIVATLAPLAIILFTGKGDMPQRVLIDARFLIGITVALALQAFTSFFGNKKIAVTAAITMAVVFVLNQSMHMTSVFYTDYLRYQLDLQVAHSVGTALKSERYAEKPVVFIGIPDTYNLTGMETESAPIFWWDRVWSEETELSGKRIIPYLQMHGYHISQAKGFKAEDVRACSATMKSWPDDGYIKDCGAYVVVKLGPTFYEIENLKQDAFLQKYDDDAYTAQGGVDGITYDNDTALLQLNCWGMLNSADSSNVKMKIALVSADKTYLLDRLETQAYNFSVPAQSAETGQAIGAALTRSLGSFSNGSYKIYMLLQYNGKKELVNLQQQITVAH